MPSRKGVTHLDRQADPPGSALPTARSDGGGFSCPKDITGSRFLTCIYEGTGEASVTFLTSSSGADVDSREQREFERLARFCTEDGEINEPLLIQDAIQRQADNLARANRRAVTQTRRLAVKWMLTKMWTLTYKEAQWDKEKIKADMNDFFQRWRVLEGKPFPYIYVLELHPEGHGYHVHLLVPSWMFTDFFQLRRVWGHGRVRFDKTKRHHGDSRDDARRVVSYIVKYITKGFDDDHVPGEHRYERAQEFVVTVKRRSFSTFREAMEYLTYFAGEVYSVVWSDYEMDSWRGPPTWVCRST